MNAYEIQKGQFTLTASEALALAKKSISDIDGMQVGAENLFGETVTASDVADSLRRVADAIAGYANRVA